MEWPAEPEDKDGPAPGGNKGKGRGGKGKGKGKAGKAKAQPADTDAPNARRQPPKKQTNQNVLTNLVRCGNQMGNSSSWSILKKTLFELVLSTLTVADYADADSIQYFYHLFNYIFL